MRNRKRIKRIQFSTWGYTGLLWTILAEAQPAHAVQVHGGAEGLYAHQIGHLFFLFAMGLLIYWLRERQLVQHSGWRFVQYSACFFILWNLDAVVAHYFADRNALFEAINDGHWNKWVTTGEEPVGLVLLYYVAKMDHLLCLPGIVFLYLGLNRLLRQEQARRSQDLRP